jgi:hypothetical protein
VRGKGREEKGGKKKGGKTIEQEKKYISQLKIKVHVRQHHAYLP